MRRVEAGELALRELGFRQVRVRDFGGHARVEVETEDLERLTSRAADVETRLLSLGFETWAAAPYAGMGAGDSPSARE